MQGYAGTCLSNTMNLRNELGAGTNNCSVVLLAHSPTLAVKCVFKAWGLQEPDRTLKLKTARSKKFPC